MIHYEILNILDMLEEHGEEFVNRIISGFSCTKNPEVCGFLKKSAIDFAKKKISITYFVLTDNGDLIAAI